MAATCLDTVDACPLTVLSLFNVVELIVPLRFVMLNWKNSWILVRVPRLLQYKKTCIPAKN